MTHLQADAAGPQSAAPPAIGARVAVWAAMTIAAATAALFVELAAKVVSSRGHALPMDLAWAGRVLAWQSDGMTHWMRMAATVHAPVVTLVILGLLFVYVRGRQWERLALFLVCVPGGMLLNVALKALIQRARPSMHAFSVGHDYGFPSGHTIAATLIAGYLLCEVWRLTPRPAWRLGATVAAMAAVAVVACSRVYLGAHHPSDVLAAMLAGVCWLCLSLLFLERRGFGLPA